MNTDTVTPILHSCLPIYSLHYSNTMACIQGHLPEGPESRDHISDANAVVSKHDNLQMIIDAYSIQYTSYLIIYYPIIEV